MTRAQRLDRLARLFAARKARWEQAREASAALASELAAAQQDGITYEDMAEHLGVSRQSLSQMGTAAKRRAEGKPAWTRKSA